MSSRNTSAIHHSQDLRDEHAPESGIREVYVSRRAAVRPRAARSPASIPPPRGPNGERIVASLTATAQDWPLAAIPVRPAQRTPMFGARPAGVPDAGFEDLPAFKSPSEPPPALEVDVDVQVDAHQANKAPAARPNVAATSSDDREPPYPTIPLFLAGVAAGISAGAILAAMLLA